MHIAPHTLRTASMFALLTRLKPSKKSGLSLMTKLKLYDGEKQVGDWDQKHIRELQEEFMDEGMSGVSPASSSTASRRLWSRAARAT